MKRPLFILMLLLPFLLVNIIKDEPSYFLLAALYIWLVKFARSLYVGVRWNEGLLAFGIGYWAKMFQSDAPKAASPNT
jgi:hypothetical protein